MCQAGPYKALRFLSDRGAVLYALNQHRGPTFLINGTADPLIVSPNTLEPFFEDLRNRTAAITGTRSGLFETYWIPNAGHRPNFVTRPAALWLERQMHFPNWTEASIDSMKSGPHQRMGYANRRAHRQDFRDGGFGGWHSSARRRRAQPEPGTTPGCSHGRMGAAQERLRMGIVGRASAGRGSGSRCPQGDDLRERLASICGSIARSFESAGKASPSGSMPQPTMPGTFRPALRNPLNSRRRVHPREPPATQNADLGFLSVPRTDTPSFQR